MFGWFFVCFSLCQQILVEDGKLIPLLKSDDLGKAKIQGML